MSNTDNLTLDVSIDGGESFNPANDGVVVKVDGLQSVNGESIELTLSVKSGGIAVSAWSDSLSAIASGNPLHDGAISYDDLVRDITGEATTKQVLEQALYWLEAEKTKPGDATPDDILKVIRRSLGLDPDQFANAEFADLQSAASPTGFSVEGEKEVYLNAFAVEDSLNDPEFALCVIDQKWLDRLNSLKAIIDGNANLTEIRALGFPVWRPTKNGEDGFDERLSIDEIVLVRDGFWFRASGKHQGAVETRHVSWGDLERFLSVPGNVAYQPSGFLTDDDNGTALKQLIEGTWEDGSDQSSS